MRYLFVIEKTSTGYSAYCPDLPGCVATGATREECETNMREAVEFHLAGMREDNDRIPEPTSTIAYAEV